MRNSYSSDPNSMEAIIQLQSGEHQIGISAEESIMDSALANGLKLVHSCLKGQCGACRALLIEGAVSMKNNFSLMDHELAEGQILLCQSFPETEKLIVKPLRQPKI